MRPIILGAVVGSLLAAIVGVYAYAYDSHRELERLREACGLAAEGAP